MRPSGVHGSPRVPRQLRWGLQRGRTKLDRDTNALARNRGPNGADNTPRAPPPIGVPPPCPHCEVGQARQHNHRAVGSSGKRASMTTAPRAASGDDSTQETARQTGGNSGKSEISSKNITSSMDAPSTMHVSLPPMPTDSWRPSACLEIRGAQRLAAVTRRFYGGERRRRRSCRLPRDDGPKIAVEDDSSGKTTISSE
ncbi:hypothetical protein C8R47DRAFT_1075696 [Mycena vitilis]|nr:hypothetical protein C8R47DRAFT_1075696 [Mycena vitilis]